MTAGPGLTAGERRARIGGHRSRGNLGPSTRLSVNKSVLKYRTLTTEPTFASDSVHFNFPLHLVSLLLFYIDSNLDLKLPTKKVALSRYDIGSNHHRLTALMAGHGPRQQGPPPPLHEFPPLGPNSPPDHSLISTPNGPNRHNISNGGRSQHRHSSEYRHNLPNGSKAIPTAPHARMGGAGPRPFGGGGGFDGARSPPNTKSMCCPY